MTARVPPGVERPTSADGHSSSGARQPRRRRPVRRRHRRWVLGRPERWRGTRSTAPTRRSSPPFRPGGALRVVDAIAPDRAGMVGLLCTITDRIRILATGGVPAYAGPAAPTSDNGILGPIVPSHQLAAAVGSGRRCSTRGTGSDRPNRRSFNTTSRAARITWMSISSGPRSGRGAAVQVQAAGASSFTNLSNFMALGNDLLFQGPDGLRHGRTLVHRRHRRRDVGMEGHQPLGGRLWRLRDTVKYSSATASCTSRPKDVTSTAPSSGKSDGTTAGTFMTDDIIRARPRRTRPRSPCSTVTWSCPPTTGSMARS